MALPRLARSTSALIAAAAVASSSPPARANGPDADPLHLLEQRIVALYQDHKDAVVQVKVATRGADQDGDGRVSLTVLSGFLIDPQGTVLTNAVPLDAGARVWIEKQGRQFLAVVLGVDPRSNIGLVQAVKPPDNLPAIALHPELEPPPIGAFAFAITSPLEFAPTPKWGIVSGRESRFSEIDFPFTYTRISIPSGPAEGGSPVFDRSGRLIGISVATLPDVDSSYLVPTKALARIVDALREQTVFRHPTAGIGVQERALPFQGESELIVTAVPSDSPAARIGIRKGDRIARIRDEPARSLDHLRDSVFFSDIGNFLPVTIGRGEELLEFALPIVASQD